MQDQALTVISFWLDCSGNLDIHRMIFCDLFASFQSFLIHIWDTSFMHSLTRMQLLTKLICVSP